MKFTRSRAALVGLVAMLAAGTGLLLKRPFERATAAPAASATAVPARRIAVITATRPIGVTFAVEAFARDGAQALACGQLANLTLMALTIATGFVVKGQRLLASAALMQALGGGI